MTKPIDATFAGLAYPRRSASADRPDVPADLRPGAFLGGIVTKLTLDGTFAYEGAVAAHVDLPRSGFDGPVAAHGLGRTEARHFEDEPALGASHGR